VAVCVVQKGGRFGRLLKPKLADKPRRAAKNGVVGDDSGPAGTGAGEAGVAVARTIRVVAVADWAGMNGAMAFVSGDAGELVYASNQDWLCVRVGERTGWVPADYWRIVTDVRASTLSVHRSRIC